MITIDENELFDNRTNMFIQVPSTTIVLEHSLISISKWEAKWHKPWLDKNEKTPDEMIDYIKCMSIKGEIPDNVIYGLTQEDNQRIIDYIHDPMTATTFKKSNKPPKQSNFVTSETLYACMVSYGVPVQFEKWHLNRLLTLLKVLEENNKEPTKRSQADIVRDYARINAANRAKFKSRG